MIEIDYLATAKGSVQFKEPDVRTQMEMDPKDKDLWQKTAKKFLKAVKRDKNVEILNIEFNEAEITDPELLELLEDAKGVQV